MSLYVYLTIKGRVKKMGTGIFIRDEGNIRELTAEEITSRFPGAEAHPMSEAVTFEVFSSNITHNMSMMASAVGLYDPLWHPEVGDWKVAADLISPLSKGLQQLLDDPEKYRVYNPENGWGSYETLVEFIEGYLAACRKYPDAVIGVSV